MDTMQALIDKLRKSGQQGQMTGNVQLSRNLDDTALTSFYDAALGRRDKNRELNMKENQFNTEMNYKTNQANKAEAYQWAGLGATALGAAGTFYNNKQQNLVMQKLIDNALGKTQPANVSNNQPNQIELDAWSKTPNYNLNPALGGEGHNAWDITAPNIDGSQYGEPFSYGAKTPQVFNFGTTNETLNAPIDNWVTNMKSNDLFANLYSLYTE